MKEKKQQQEDDNQFNMNLLYAPELEKVVLGTLMTDKKAYALISDILNPEKPDVPLNKNDAFQKVQKRRVQKKR